MTVKKSFEERNPLAMTRLQLPSAIADGGQAYCPFCNTQKVS